MIVEYLWGDRSFLEGILLISWDHIVFIVWMVEILVKFGYINDVFSCLVFEVDEKDILDGVVGLDESKRKFVDRFDFF